MTNVEIIKSANISGLQDLKYTSTGRIDRNQFDDDGAGPSSANDKLKKPNGIVSRRLFDDYDRSSASQVNGHKEADEYALLAEESRRSLHTNGTSSSQSNDSNKRKRTVDELLRDVESVLGTTISS